MAVFCGFSLYQNVCSGEEGEIHDGELSLCVLVWMADYKVLLYGAVGWSSNPTCFSLFATYMSTYVHAKAEFCPHKGTLGPLWGLDPSALLSYTNPLVW